MHLRETLHFPTDTDYTALYGGQTFTVLRPLTSSEADLYDVGPMFKVLTQSGAEIDVFWDEISDAPIEAAYTFEHCTTCFQHHEDAPHDMGNITAVISLFEVTEEQAKGEDHLYCDLCGEPCFPSLYTAEAERV